MYIKITEARFAKISASIMKTKIPLKGENNMKKKVLVLGMVLAMSLSLTACKSTDYKDAVELEESGDYAGALEIFNTLTDYKDANDHAVSCQAMVDAISAYDTASSEAATKNEELDSKISDAEALLAEGKTALDETLIPALETAVSNTKAAKVEIPDMPATEDEILAVVDELNAIDYTSALAELVSSQEALETSIAQYALVDNPSEGYIIECLGEVEHVVDISAVTEDNDPNGNLNKAGGYTAQVYFSSDLVNQSSVSGSTVIEKGTDCGGSIEVYANVDDANKRNDYLATFDGSIFASGSHTLIGTCVVRTSDNLKASEQKEMEANIIEALISLE